MGIFKKINFGLTKTRNKMAGAIDDMLDSFDEVTDDLYTELEEILNKEWDNKFSYGTVKSVHLKAIILHYSDNSKLNEVVENLRRVEEKLRNMAAHQIVSVDEEIIQTETGFTGKQIMDNIKQLFLYTGMNVKKEYWNSYDELNDLIYKKMELRKTDTE